MCGIGGILRTDGQPIPEEWLDAIDARIAYRGPDGCGRFRDKVTVEVNEVDANGAVTVRKRTVEAALVHRRLAIIDIAEGVQPMVSARGRNDAEGLVAVVFNGCIYNHRELRRELEANGHQFVTDHSDTEVLIHGWREWREDLREHLEGMYALGIWDRTSAMMLLGRDTFGEKPLYMLHRIAGSTFKDGNLFAFSSSYGSLEWLRKETADEPGMEQEIAGVHLQRGYVAAELMAAYRPSEVEPSCVCEYSGTMAAPMMACRGLDWDGEASAEHIEDLIRKAVQRRLEADVPLGCFLSGGVDSSLIAYFAKERCADLKGYTVRMPEARFDESHFAIEAARHVGIGHRVLEVEAKPAEDLAHLIGILGQPFGDSSILPTYWVSKAARQEVKVALSGEGGDELFMGYERYAAARFLAKHWRWLKALPVRPLHRAHRKSTLNKLARLADMAGDYEALGVGAMESLFTQSELKALLGAAPESRESLHEVFSSTQDDAAMRLRMYDVNTYLPHDLLRKVDTASMACGLEVRCPFLDRDLARAALSLPVETLMPGGQRKGLLRAIARKYLPREIVDRPKMGFAIPIGEWFRNDDLPHKGSGMRTMLLDHLHSAEPFGAVRLNRKAVERYVEEHMSGKRDHGQKLFALLTLSMWAKQGSRKPGRAKRA